GPRGRFPGPEAHGSVGRRAVGLLHRDPRRRRPPGAGPPCVPARTLPVGLTRRWAALCFLAAAPASAQGASAPPPYQIVRHDEDYSYLSDPARRTDALDPIKYIALSSSRPDVYLSLGGELRERLEIFDNANWLPVPANAFLLQKYMLSADLHLGSRVRVFANFKSGLEDGRTGGPRPTDEDKLDVHEAFFDLRLGEKKTAIIPGGRREYGPGSE